MSTFIPSALSLPLPKGDESTFEVLGNVLHTLVECAPCCLSCSSQLRRRWDLGGKLDCQGDLGELVANAANAGHPPAAPAGHDGGTVDVVVGKPSEPGRNTHDPRQQLQPVPVSTPTEGGLSRTEAATGDLQPSHSLWATPIRPRQRYEAIGHRTPVFQTHHLRNLTRIAGQQKHVGNGSFQHISSPSVTSK